MRIYPAVDILGGKAVRLFQGDYDRVTVFNDSPADAARAWVRKGSEDLHIVDLDGARYGKSYIGEIIREIKAEVSVRIQVGGGIRSLDDIEERLSSGADRVIIGTAAVRDPQLVREAVGRWGAEKIAVGIDAKNGFAAVKGWQEVSEISAVSLGLKMKECGITTIIYTDISRDGTMSGPNIAATEEMAKRTGLDIIASGGISSMRDIENAETAGAAGVIVGRAVYDGSLDLGEVIERFARK